MEYRQGHEAPFTHYLYIRSDVVLDRFYDRRGSKGRSVLTLKPEVLEWLDNHPNIPLNRQRFREAALLGYSEAECPFDFASKDDAMLFKLTWGGE